VDVLRSLPGAPSVGWGHTSYAVQRKGALHWCLPMMGSSGHQGWRDHRSGDQKKDRKWFVLAREPWKFNKKTHF